MSSRALLVDDESDFLNHLSETLTHEGLRVTSAAVGEDAMQRCQEEDFDLLITDLRLPGPIDGWDLIESARVHNPGIDTVAVTAYPAEDHKTKAQALGVFAYLEKPVPISQITNTVRWCMQKRKLEADLGALRTSSTASDSTTSAVYSTYNSLPYPSMIVTDQGDILLANEQAHKLLKASKKISPAVSGIGLETRAFIRPLIDLAFTSNGPTVPDSVRVNIGGNPYGLRVWKIDGFNHDSPLAIFLEPLDHSEALERSLLDSDTARVWLPILLNISK